MAYFGRKIRRRKRAAPTASVPFNSYAVLNSVDHPPAHQPFAAKTSSGETPRMLADEDVHVNVIKYLRARSFDTMRVQWSKLAHKPDLEVFNYAAANNRVLLTQDRGYIKRAGNPASPFGFGLSPGVIVLPSPMGDHISRSPEAFDGMRIALDKFSLNPDLARGKVCEFTAYGQMIVHTPARPKGAPVHILRLVAKS